VRSQLARCVLIVQRKPPESNEAKEGKGEKRREGGEEFIILSTSFPHTGYTSKIILRSIPPKKRGKGKKGN